MLTFKELQPRDCFRFVNGADWKTSPETRAMVMLAIATPETTVDALTFVLPLGWASCRPWFYNRCADEPVELLEHFSTHPTPTCIAGHLARRSLVQPSEPRKFVDG